MIDCRACGFSVNPAMRHSLVRNCCPSCGGALFGDSHKRRLDLFKQRLSGQEFAQSLNDDMIFDIALFMLVEFYPPEEKSEPSVDGEKTLSDSEEDLALNEEDSYEKIRDAVRSEVLADVDSEGIDSDLDMKVARLKRIAKEKPIRNTGPAVRRVTGD